MSEAEALQPCPFCGGDIVGIVTDVTFTQADHSATYSMPPHVACACGACGPREKTEAEAIAAWNARESIPIAKVREVAEKLEALADEWSQPNPPQARGYRKSARLVRELLGGE